MPYAWSDLAGDQGGRCLRLWPHRSLPRRGFVIFIAVTCGMFALPLASVFGTSMLWGLLPFLMLGIGGIWWALERSYRDGDMSETLRIGADEVLLLHRPARGPVRDWRCPTYWARAEMHPTQGPVPHYITLRGNGRMVELGTFLSEDERRALFGDLVAALAR